MNERMVGYMEDTLDFTITGQNGWYLKIDQGFPLTPQSHLSNDECRR
jgi:hypothetical protein